MDLCRDDSTATTRACIRMLKILIANSQAFADDHLYGEKRARILGTLAQTNAELDAILREERRGD
jgi:hypothetical protein